MLKNETHPNVDALALKLHVYLLKIADKVGYLVKKENTEPLIQDLVEIIQLRCDDK